LSDGKHISERFKHSKMVLYLASIPKEDIAEYFDPYNVKEKWQRFFNASSYKA
jgi:hypothetical protein